MQKCEGNTKKILILTILFLVIGQFIAGCSSDTSSPTPALSRITVTFKITGTAKAALMQFECMVSDDYAAHIVKVPWTLTLGCRNVADGKITLKAFFYYEKDASPITSGPGTLTCEIYIDGELVDSDSETVEDIKGWPSAECSYQP